MLTDRPEDCGCGKNPAPLGRPAPQPAPRSLISSLGGGSGRITHVAPNGKRTDMVDMVAGKAALIRSGGRLDFS